MENLLKIWMPISKNTDGTFSAILTDTSLDRDDELMSEGVIDTLSKKLSLPALADHENKMDSWVGTFKNLQKIEHGGHYAVMGEPTFFSKEANPKAVQIQKQIEEAAEMGGSCGISIGAKPIKSKMVEKDGKDYKQWTDIEVMEATFTPIQSNRNSYAYVAKSFNLELTKPEKVESCVKKLMADPNFKPKKGTKKEAAYAVCQEKVGKKNCDPCDLTKSKEEQIDEMMLKFKTEIRKIIEVDTMAKKEDLNKDKDPKPEGEGSEPEGGKPKDAPVEPPKEPEKPEGEETPAADDGNQDSEEGAEKKISPELQKWMDTKIQEGIEKAVKKMPLYKAITENINLQQEQIQDSKPMGFIEKHLANRAGYQEVKG